MRRRPFELAAGLCGLVYGSFFRALAAPISLAGLFMDPPPYPFPRRGRGPLRLSWAPHCFADAHSWIAPPSLCSLERDLPCHHGRDDVAIEELARVRRAEDERIHVHHRDVGPSARGQDACLALVER